MKKQYSRKSNDCSKRIHRVINQEGEQSPSLKQSDMIDVERMMLRDTINGQEWAVGDKFFCPIHKHEEGTWAVSAESFKFLLRQIDAIKAGEAFRFYEVNDGTYIKALEECNRLVEQLNNEIV